MALAAAVDSPAAVAAASAVAVVPVRICLSAAFHLRFWLVWCEGRRCSLRLKAGCLLGSARLRAGCLRGSAADNDDCAADGNGGQIAHRAFRAAEAVLLLDRASAVQLPLAGSGLVIMGIYDCSF